MFDWQVREVNLIGEKAVDVLAKKHVAIFGLGGVGSYCAEALARAGVGTLTICDGDRIDVSNINRQLYALNSTVGRLKTAVAAKRLKDINPNIVVNEKPLFFDAETKAGFDFSSFDHVVDCVDTVTAKLLLAECCKSADKPIIACLGTGNKLNTDFKTADVFDTKICPLAKVMRRELKKRGIEKLKVVYSEEEPREPLCEDKRTPASISFVPPVAGLKIAGEVIKDLLKNSEVSV